jgi:hypothetical protein
MFGIIFGTICLILLFKVLFGWRYWRGHGGYGYRGGPRRWFLRRLFYRLGTGPAQEKVVLEEYENLRQTVHSLKDELKTTRSEIAGAVREDRLDRAKIENVFRQQDELIAKLRTAVFESMSKVHGVLDERQRKDLAALFETGFGHHGYGC